MIRALQMRDSTGLATPADWDEGDTLMLPDDMSNAQARRIFDTAPVTLAP